jgi:trk system potassium uptake protein
VPGNKTLYMKPIRRKINKNAVLPVFSGFLTVIVFGMLLLKLPVASVSGSIPWIDAFFTATSAVCVTGLIVVDTGSYFTPFGQWVILGLIQIGGMGIMTIAVLFFQWIGRKISLKQRIFVQDQFSHQPRKDIFRLIYSVALLTFSVEALGAISLFFCWKSVMPFRKALYHSVFHSVSAFCNAGFSLNADSMSPFRDNIGVNVTMSLLIILGGLGFPVLYDLVITFRNRKRRTRLTVQSRTVLVTSVVLIVLGALAFGYLERYSPNAPQSLTDRILTAFFQSVTCRTAGFNTVDIAALRDTTLIIMIFLMFFGASPGSCGGGVKTTTLAIVIAFVISRLKRREHVNLFNKSLPTETVNRSMALIVMAIALIGIILFLILAGDASRDSSDITGHGVFLACLFETVSAFGTVGLSLGITPDLGIWGKIWIIIMMIIGRLGVLTFAYLITGSGTEKGIEYAEENVMIG